MTEFRTDICENEKKFELVFQTDNKAYFEKMQATARECIDHKPVTQFDRIKAMSVEEMAEFICGIFDIQPDDSKFINGDLIPMYDENEIRQWLESEVSE